VLKNFSQCWALYCLVYFEHGCAKLLHPISPMPKFWSIKLIVLATFWQEITLSIVVSLGMFSWEGFYVSHYVPYLYSHNVSATDHPHCNPYCEEAGVPCAGFQAQWAARAAYDRVHGGGGGGGGGESFLRVHWVAVPEVLRARRVNRRAVSSGGCGGGARGQRVRSGVGVHVDVQRRHRGPGEVQRAVQPEPPEPAHLPRDVRRGVGTPLGERGMSVLYAVPFRLRFTYVTEEDPRMAACPSCTRFHFD
jgi:hypothetical protein